MRKHFEASQIDWLTKSFLFSVVVGMGISYSKLYLFHILFVLLGIRLIATKRIAANVGLLASRDSVHLLLIFFGYLLAILWARDLKGAIVYQFYLFLGIGIIWIFLIEIDNIDKMKNIDYPIEVTEISADEGGGFSACIPQLGRNVFLADGETLAEALKNLEEIKKKWFEYYFEKGIRIPEPVI